MKTAKIKPAGKKSLTKIPIETKKMSKAGIAMQNAIGRGSIIELSPDPWNLHP